MILQPLPGDAEVVRGLAAHLRARAQQMADLAGLLARLREASTVWESPAGVVFATRLAGLPPSLDLVVDRYAVAAAALIELAEVLGREQPIIQACVYEESQAQRQILLLEDELARLAAGGLGRGDPLYEVLLADQRREVARAQEARARHTAAWARFTEADTRCADRLAAAARDRLQDGLAYRSVRGAAQLADGVAALGALGTLHPGFKAAGVVGAGAGGVSDAVMLLAYDEGSWGDLAADVAFAATTGTGSALKAGSALTGQFSRAERIRAGVAAATRAKVDEVRGPLRITPFARPGALAPSLPAIATGGSFTARGLLTKGVNAARSGLDRALLDDWRLAVRNGKDAKVHFVTGEALLRGSWLTQSVVNRLGPSPHPPVSSSSCARSPDHSAAPVVRVLPAR
mgnify:CR=1 FL=1|jgi:hypothetical protein